MCLYSILLGFTMELFNGNISLRNYRIDNAFPTFELEVHNVLTLTLETTSTPALLIKR